MTMMFDDDDALHADEHDSGGGGLRRSVFTGRPVEPHSMQHVAVSALAGAVASGIPHALLTPVELIKTNIQVHPDHFHSFLPTWHAIKDNAVPELGFAGGRRSLLRGWGATLAGYSIAGSLQFGLYEVLRYRYAQMLGDDWLQNKKRVWMAAAASSEVIASVALCPFETVRARIQAQPQFARGLFDGLPKVLAAEGFKGLYAGLGPLWLRQVPVTVLKLTTFEGIIDYLYKFMPREAHELSGREQVAVMFWAGGVVGLFSTLISHPADTLFSLVANGKPEDGSALQRLRTILIGTAEKPGIGFFGLWRGGLTRVLLLSSVTGWQMFLYALVRVYGGINTPVGY